MGTAVLVKALFQDLGDSGCVPCWVYMIPCRACACVPCVFVLQTCMGNETALSQCAGDTSQSCSDAHNYDPGVWCTPQPGARVSACA